MHCSKKPYLLDHLFNGEGERSRHSKTERRGGLEVANTKIFRNGRYRRPRNDFVVFGSIRRLPIDFARSRIPLVLRSDLEDRAFRRDYSFLDQSLLDVIQFRFFEPDVVDSDRRCPAYLDRDCRCQTR